MMRQALSTAEGTVQLFLKHKEQELMALKKALPNQRQEHATQSVENSIQQPNLDPASLMWSDELLWTAPSLNNVDWNQFWIGSIDTGTNPGMAS